MGERVEVSGDAFCAGAWSGGFETFGFDDAETLLGSGGRALGDKFRFACPSHPLERLYALRAEDSSYVSNSLAFLLAEADDGPDLAYPGYFFDFLNGLRRGVLGPPVSVPTAAGRTVESYADACFSIAPDLSIARRQRSHTSVRSYAHLKELLARQVSAVCANATDASRPAGAFGLLATLSRGYDSTATAALAVRHGGCTEGATFTRSAAKSGALVDDDGGVGTCSRIQSISVLRAEMSVSTAFSNGSRGVQKMKFSRASSGGMASPSTSMADERSDNHHERTH